MPQIFINYRRGDSSTNASRLCEWLGERYGPEQVFMDVEAIAPGRPWREAIDRAVGSSDLVLAVIGKDWLPELKRRLDEPKDFMRHELETALSRDVSIIPVLEEGATMPEADELPNSLAALTDYQAFQLIGRFQIDKQELLKSVDRALGLEPQPEHEGPSRPAASRMRQLVNKSTVASRPRATKTNNTEQARVHKTISVPLDILNLLEESQKELEAYIRMHIELVSSERARKSQELISSIRTYLENGDTDFSRFWREIEKNLDEIKPLGASGRAHSMLDEAIEQFDQELARSKSLVRQIMDPSQRRLEDQTAVASALLTQLYSVRDAGSDMVDTCCRQVDERLRSISELTNFILLKALEAKHDVRRTVTASRDLQDEYGARARLERDVEVQPFTPTVIRRAG